MESVNTVCRILKIAVSLKKPMIQFGKSYIVDELFNYVSYKNNRACIAYSLEQETKTVTEITTDKLHIYKILIPSGIHSTKYRGINRIERQNLTLRTHLKRLGRRTICFSRSLAALSAVVWIYFWGVS